METSLRHTSGRLQFLVGYTYSKAVDNASSWGPGGNASGGVEIINPVNPKLGKSLSAFDLTHNFVASFAYQLPFDKLLPANRATRGWTLTGITRFATGLPVFTTEQDDRSLLGTGGTGPTGSGVDAPNFTPGPLQIADPRKQNLAATPLQNPYFNISLFRQEPLGLLGTANRRFFHGPGINNWDLGILKDLKLTESKSLQFRAEFFSVFNHAQFSNPDGNFIDSAFGFVTSAGGERVGQVAVKFLLLKRAKPVGLVSEDIGQVAMKPRTSRTGRTFVRRQKNNGTATARDGSASRVAGFWWRPRVRSRRCFRNPGWPWKTACLQERRFRPHE